MVQQAVWLLPMGGLILLSGLFSASEAALFYLDRATRMAMRDGSTRERSAAALLDDPDRLLSTILFWNLLVNVVYFTLVSIIGLRLQEEGLVAEAGVFSVGALLAIIVFSEMLPKSLAVLQAKRLAGWFAMPLTLAIRAARPVLPVFQWVHLISRRVLLPRFQAEPYLRTGDLERAVELSADDAAAAANQQRVLQNIVSLSDLRADELMRPRVRFSAFRPPVALSDLQGEMPPSGYLLITEPDSDEVASAITLAHLSEVPTERLEDHAEAVIYVPWCMTAAAAMDLLQQQERRVAAVINEFGETIGILTYDDVLATIFGRRPSRSRRLLSREPIRQVDADAWHATGMTSLRRVARHFGLHRTRGKTVTIAGVVQEALERFPVPGDECRWGPLQLRVVEASEDGTLLVEITRIEGSVSSEEDPPEDRS